MNTVIFQGVELKVEYANYMDNDRPAIELKTLDGNPWMRASVNLPDEPMEANEIAIKDYSENAGILRVLIDADIISEPVRDVRSGYVNIAICNLKEK